MRLLKQSWQKIPHFFERFAHFITDLLSRLTGTKKIDIFSAALFPWQLYDSKRQLK